MSEFKIDVRTIKTLSDLLNDDGFKTFLAMLKDIRHAKTEELIAKESPEVRGAIHAIDSIFAIMSDEGLSKLYERYKNNNQEKTF